MPPSDPHVRRRAAALAGHTGDVGAATSAWADPDPSVRVAGLRSLDRLGDLDQRLLLAALADEHPAVRLAALELAARRPAPSAVPLLDDADPGVVECACWAVGEQPHPGDEGVARLVSLAAGHDDLLVRESAVAALGALGDVRGLPAVLAATRDKPAIRRRAVLALAAFDGPEVEAAWARARDDRDRQVRDAVDELLGPATEDPEG